MCQEVSCFNLTFKRFWFFRNVGIIDCMHYSHRELSVQSAANLLLFSERLQERVPYTLSGRSLVC